MAGIRNFQRRALEALVNGRPAQMISVGKDRRYSLEGKEIVLWGISRGVGTCSDLHGVDIAVFGEKGDSVDVAETPCRLAALLRDPVEGECREDGISRKVVEELAVRKIKPGWIEFERTGRKQIYVSTIC